MIAYTIPETKLYLDESVVRLVFNQAPKDFCRAFLRGLQKFTVTKMEHCFAVIGLSSSGATSCFGIPHDSVIGSRAIADIRTLSVWNKSAIGIQKLCERPVEAFESVVSPTEADPEASDLMKIANDGPRLRDTNYWETQQAEAGLVIVSCNAGQVRVLVPPRAEQSVKEGLRGVTRIEVDALPVEHWVPGKFCSQWLFEDHSQTPYVMQLSPAAFFDFAPTPAFSTVSFWGKGGAGPRCIATLPLVWRRRSELCLHRGLDKIAI